MPTAGRRRLGRRPVRRLRRQDSELSADHAGLELHGAALSLRAAWDLSILTPKRPLASCRLRPRGVPKWMVA